MNNSSLFLQVKKYIQALFCEEVSFSTDSYFYMKIHFIKSFLSNMVKYHDFVFGYCQTPAGLHSNAQ